MRNELGIGKFIVSPQARDAIHVAVFPAVSKHTLIAGDQVILVTNKPDQRGRYEVRPATDELDAIGVVDPFLSFGAPIGVGFWVMLKPGTATGLRHEYTHPLLDGG